MRGFSCKTGKSREITSLFEQSKTHLASKHLLLKLPLARRRDFCELGHPSRCEPIANEFG